jgi:hypothetical protein
MRKIALLLLALSPALAQTAPRSTATPSDPSPQASPVPGNAPYGLAALAPQSGEDANAKKGRELLQKMIAKLGGEAYLSFQTMTQYGRSYAFYQGKPNSVGIEFWRFYKYPDKDRSELTKERDVIYIINGDKGYEITYKGVAAQDAPVLAETLRRRNHSLDIVLRNWLKDPKTLVFYDGPATASQKMVEQVSIINSANEQVTIAIDANDMLPVRRVFTYRDPTDKLKDEDGELYANYRLVQGIMTAHSVTRTKNGDMTNQRFINEVQYNVPIPDSKFDAAVSYDPYKRSGKRE